MALALQVEFSPPVRYRGGVTGNPELIEAIRREIAAAGGRITFARFMELALYHPQHGYYTTGKHRIGKQGDFFTSVSVGPLFGRILAAQFRKWGATDVLEFGGHRGQLRADVLAAAPELNYRVVEVGEALPEQTRNIVFSNEFLDALPVHRICGDREVYVVERASCPLPGERMAGNGQDARSTVFTEELGELSDARLPRLPAGYRSEINLRALDWLEDVTRRLQSGDYIVTIDYGFERADYFAPHHKDGHLQCYYRHTKNADPYRHVGEQDITAHVEFTSLIERGEQLGLETVLFTDQTHFLLQAGEAEIAEIVQRTAGQFSAERNAVHQLLHSTMGHAFKVLVQRKAV